MDYFGYEISFYNKFACETQTFYVLAKNEEEAERIFYLKYDKESYGEDCLEHIYDYFEPHFYTESEILQNNK